MRGFFFFARIKDIERNTSKHVEFLAIQPRKYIKQYNTQRHMTSDIFFLQQNEIRAIALTCD